jgi:hypothetical protein
VENVETAIGGDDALAFMFAPLDFMSSRFKCKAL